MAPASRTKCHHLDIARVIVPSGVVPCQLRSVCAVVGMAVRGFCLGKIRTKPSMSPPRPPLSHLLTDNQRNRLGCNVRELVTRLLLYDLFISSFTTFSNRAAAAGSWDRFGYRHRHQSPFRQSTQSSKGHHCVVLYIRFARAGHRPNGLKLKRSPKGSRSGP